MAFWESFEVVYVENVEVELMLVITAKVSKVNNGEYLCFDEQNIEIWCWNHVHVIDSNQYLYREDVVGLTETEYPGTDTYVRLHCHSADVHI